MEKNNYLSTTNIKWECPMETCGHFNYNGQYEYPYRNLPL